MFEILLPLLELHPMQLPGILLSRRAFTATASDTQHEWPGSRWCVAWLVELGGEGLGKRGKLNGQAAGGWSCRAVLPYSLPEAMKTFAGVLPVYCKGGTQESCRSSCWKLCSSFGSGNPKCKNKRSHVASPRLASPQITLGCGRAPPGEGQRVEAGAVAEDCGDVQGVRPAAGGLLRVPDAVRRRPLHGVRPHLRQAGKPEAVRAQVSASAPGCAGEEGLEP
eukprot:scaffold748_cov251-Pinguiococcus_pyrenoidosus.AAC.27